MRWIRRAPMAPELAERLGGIDAHVGRLEGRLEALTAQLEALTVQLADSRHAADAAESRIREELDTRIRPLLLSLVRDDPGNRRRLFELRASADYALAFTEPDPLVSVVMTTLGERAELLLQRALPSALAQSHRNLEVVIVGDVAGEDLRVAVEALGDSRIRFADLTQRFLQTDPQKQWLAGSIMTRNQAYDMARGRWMVELDDDDALRPEAITHLLGSARDRRLEVVYGMSEQRDLNGETETLGRFPPRPRDPDWRERGLPYQPWDGTAGCGSIVHAGLRFFAREHVAADIPAPGDYFRLERMVRSGVRFGMIDEVVYEYYPSLLWGRRVPAPAQQPPGNGSGPRLTEARPTPE